MKNPIILLIVSFLFASCNFPARAQNTNFSLQLWETYSEFKEEKITKRRITHKDIQPLIEDLQKKQGFSVEKVGESIEGRDLSVISIGEGETDIFLWSQMHGDESTATMAIFDIFNFLASDSFKPEKDQLLKNVTLHFLPMLNPDGAEVFQRRNTLGIDVNRDALRLQSPEGRTLKRVRDSLEADFGFNLHDQSKYYNAETTNKPATISFLAPAYNYEKSINQTRGDAMRVIVGINKELQKVIPGQVARYNDDFEPRAFGDNIQKWGTSTILIESGGFQGDPEKQEIRKMNYLAILSAIFSISEQMYKDQDISSYEKIPENDSKLFDLKLVGLNYELLGNNYILDVGINHNEIPHPGEKGYYLQGRITDLGDLSTFYGYDTFDATEYKMVPGSIYPRILENLADLDKLNYYDILSKGYSYIKIKNLPSGKRSTIHPVQIVSENFKVPTRLSTGTDPTFFLEKNGKKEFAVINGFLQPLDNFKDSVENGVIIR
jgi:hypothetical protein